MPTTDLYPLDLTGSQPSNTIRNEKHTVSPPSQITQSSFIVMRACPFFAHNIVVKDGPSATARTLVFGEDYILTHKSIALTLLCKKGVYASIMFNDRNYTGSVYVTYNTVGGDYTLPDYTIVEQQTRQKYTILNVSFDQIAGLPAAYPHAPHQHDPEDMVGLSEVVLKLSDLSAAIRGNQGSFGLLNVGFNNHINSSSAHTSAAVGLGSVLNYGTANAVDFVNRAANKYATAVGVTDYVSMRLTNERTIMGANYLTKEDGALLYVKDDDVYSKAESDNLYYTRSYQDSNFLKTNEAITESHVGSIVNTIVDLSQYHTRTEALGVFYTRTQSDLRYYTKTQIDNSFVTQTAGDQRYIQTSNVDAILSDKSDNNLSIEDGKFYVGKQAPIEVYSLYIDCINGSDNSPGTRAAPLKSLKRAHALSPNNRSSTWYLRHYTIEQLASSNIRYTWDFEHAVEQGSTRTISVYGNTWIDGSKNSSSRQQADGNIRWELVEQVTRVPIHISVLPSSTGLSGIYGTTLADQSLIKFSGIMLVKPKVTLPAPTTKLIIPELSFIKGAGTFVLIGTWLMQTGEYQSADSTFFRWYDSKFDKQVKVFAEASSYGYTLEKIVNGVTIFDTDTTSIFKYTNSLERPFVYTNSLGEVLVSSENHPGKGALAAGGTALKTNLGVVMQRTNMFSGLNLVNNVCTNIVTNLTLVG